MRTRYCNILFFLLDRFAVDKYIEKLPLFREIYPYILLARGVLDIFPALGVGYYLVVTETGITDFED